MLAYTWGICDGNITRSLVEITFNNDYSNICKSPSTGMYYQSPNYYHPIPFDCLGIAYDKLLTYCPSIKAKMHKLVNDTCAVSIPKLCKTQYEQNPPFSCTKLEYSTPLTVLSLAASNTLTLFGLFSVLTYAILFYLYTKYEPTLEELNFLAPPAEGQNSLATEFCEACSGIGQRRGGNDAKVRDAGALEMALPRSVANNNSNYDRLPLGTVVGTQPPHTLAQQHGTMSSDEGKIIFGLLAEMQQKIDRLERERQEKQARTRRRGGA